MSGQRVYSMLAQAGPSSSNSLVSFHSLTPFLGREQVLNELCGQVRDPLTRILTLTGLSGVGKTRLAVALLEKMATEFADGGRYVDIVGNTPDDLLETLAAAVGIVDVEAGSAFRQVVDHLRERHFLLVLDSAEHLLDDVSSLVVTLAAACSSLTVLVVSIEKLGVYGEHVVRLGPLEVPGPSLTDIDALGRVPSIKLFVHRARAVRSGFQLTPENHQAIAELCRRLDGLPLAIELAAARLQTTGPQDVLTNLDRDPGLLWGTQASTLSRHLCLQASFEKGWRRLAGDEQALLCRLVVFAGEFCHADVSAVAEQPGRPSLLANLVDKSFLLAAERPDGDVRFRILRITRDHLLARVGDTGEMRQTRQRHADHFLAMAENAGPAMRGPGQGDALRRLMQYQDDLEAAADYLVTQRDRDRLGRLAVVLAPFWLAVGRPHTAARRLRQAQAPDGLSALMRARLRFASAESALALGQLDAAHQHAAAAAAGYAEAGDDGALTACEHLTAQLAHRREDPAVAEELLIRVILRYRDTGDVAGHGRAVGDLAVIYHDQCLYEPARQLADEALTSLAQVGDGRSAAHLTFTLAGALLGLGDPAVAEQHCREALLLLRDLGDRPGVAVGLLTQAAVLAHRHGRITESWRRAACLAATASTVLTFAAALPRRHLATMLDGIVEEAQARLGDESFRAQWAYGADLSLDQAVAEALAPLSTPRLIDETAATLTLREHEVAELVAAGLTNREIGRRLGIAEWTVVNHMRKVMRKLRCSSRVQVARWMTGQQQIRERPTPDSPMSATG